METVEVAQPAGFTRVVDEVGRNTANAFSTFLETYGGAPGAAHAPQQAAAECSPLRRPKRVALARRDRYTAEDGADPFYLTQIKIMRQDERTTLFVDYSHVLQYSEDLAGVIVTEYYQYGLRTLAAAQSGRRLRPTPRRPWAAHWRAQCGAVPPGGGAAGGAALRGGLCAHG